MKESPFLSTYELTPLFREAFPALQVHRSTILRALHHIGLSVKKDLRRGGPVHRSVESVEASVLLAHPTHHRCEGCDLHRRNRVPSGHGPAAWMGSRGRATGGSGGGLVGRQAYLHDRRDGRSRDPTPRARGRRREGTRFPPLLLGPSLRPGKVVVMDNLRLHKNAKVLRFLGRGCRCVFVPPIQPRHQRHRAGVLEDQTSRPQGRSDDDDDAARRFSCRLRQDHETRRSQLHAPRGLLVTVPLNLIRALVRAASPARASPLSERGSRLTCTRRVALRAGRKQRISLRALVRS